MHHKTSVIHRFCFIKSIQQTSLLRRNGVIIRLNGFSAKQFAYFLWNVDILNYDDIYINCEDEIDRFKENGFAIRNYDFCAVAVYENNGK